MTDAAIERELRGEAAQEAFGAMLAAACRPPLLVFLDGDLGAGKTTLVRGLLRALGHAGAVKSPTYTLIEPYDIDGRSVYHLDLYRLADPGELEYLGLRDLLAERALILVEWPRRGAGWLPPADLVVHIDGSGDRRRLRVTAGTTRGEQALSDL
ncbi:MAG: tRNA (adenosine(37)-N6)-threonylcarbamoyltransferase complex ATPase subunit type 1 TsaE [Gammaproteobacteria bacterium]|nr:tRNA (adenosine(37)-N6)-threonylcarbamoyltransferase complex ATPase subunit type 1 TsaE [Gammaproteobacteria bacterium]